MTSTQLFADRHLTRVLLLIALLVLTGGAVTAAEERTYTNPLHLTTADGMTVESCADPSVVHANSSGENAWYMVCTTDPLSGSDRHADGELNFHLLPIFRSTDLVHWHYVGDVFESRPAWVEDDAGLWAPALVYLNNRYTLYYTAEETKLLRGGSAIGVASSPTPIGPWRDSGKPVVEPTSLPCCPGQRRWTFDPAIVTDELGQRYIYYGSYVGGISMRHLSVDGLHSDPASEVQITIGERYEGANVIRRHGYYYLIVSATACCNGPLTGYSIFVGRARTPKGPFVDREGVSLLDSQVGGTPVISLNGNRWVGTGHHDIVTDLAGQDWLLYHAIDRTDPYFAGEIGFTKRPVLLDALEWVDDWPSVRAGRWASDTPQRMPVTQFAARAYVPLSPLPLPTPLQTYPELTHEFGGSTLAAQWQWVRPPAMRRVKVQEGMLRIATQAADLYEASNDASLLWQPAPPQNYIVETRLRLSVPPDGCCFNYVQAGLVIYGDDDNYLKLVHVAIGETRQTEFAKEQYPVREGYPRYGNTVIGPPGEWTALRIARTRCGAEECYTGYSSRDGVTWVRGGTWTHRLGDRARIGLVAMGGAGFTAYFDYVRTYQLPP